MFPSSSSAASSAGPSALLCLLALATATRVTALPTPFAPIYNIKNAAAAAAAAETTSAPDPLDLDPTAADPYWIATGPAFSVPALRYYNGSLGDAPFTGGRGPTPSLSLAAPTYPAAQRREKRAAAAVVTAGGAEPIPTNPKRTRRSAEQEPIEKRGIRWAFTAAQSARAKAFADRQAAAAAAMPSSASTSTPVVLTTTTTTTLTAAKTTTPPATKTSAAAAPTATWWKEKSYFYSLASFLEDVVDKRHWTWGSQNVEVLGKGVPASQWKDGRQGDSKSALQVAYPKGSRNPSSNIVGGMGFYSSKLDISQANNVSFSYGVFFPNDFDFVKGGKLPGLYAGQHGCSGGNAAASCWSARLMFRSGGMGELYLYAPRDKQVEALCTLGPLSYCNSVYGMSIGRGSWTFRRGEWSNIRQDIWLNTPGKADGGFNIWVNGELVLHSDSVYYRNSVVGQISNGTGSGVPPPPLIDYDNLPDSLVIPNGGFKSNPLLPTSSSTSTPVAAASSTPTPSPTRQRQRQRRQLSLVPSFLKRATVSVPSFSGAMVQTFFGGSSASWNSPKLQYSYFRGLKLQINDS